MAEFLERGRNAAVSDVSAQWDDDTRRITLVGDEHPAVEIWESQRNAVPLPESAFNRRVTIDSMAAPADYERKRRHGEPVSPFRISGSGPFF